MIPYYLANFVPNPKQLFEHCQCLPWLSVTETRKEYFMSLRKQTYTYGSGKGMRTYTSEMFSFIVEDIRLLVNQELSMDFNLCFLNRYDDERQHLGWHADNFKKADPHSHIAVVSVGAEREIWWKPNDYKGEIPPQQRQLLGHGSLWVMPAGFQEKYQHRIPKHPTKCGPRISLTFRKHFD